MRNQTWNGQGLLLEDIELVRIAGSPVAINHLSNIQRPATAEEAAFLDATEKQERKQQARGQVIAAIKANKQQGPWGKMFYDLAIAQGWIEE